MYMPLCELADRFVILRLKHEHLPNDQNIMDLQAYFARDLIAEINSFDEPIRIQILEQIELLYKQNAVTWGYESDIRNGKLDNPESMIEVGKRTLLIRESNKKRVQIKNKISLLASQAYGIEEKINHLSSDK